MELLLIFPFTVDSMIGKQTFSTKAHTHPLTRTLFRYRERSGEPKRERDLLLWLSGGMVKAASNFVKHIF